jgi:cytochrome c oxidase subunit 3
VVVVVQLPSVPREELAMSTTTATAGSGPVATAERASPLVVGVVVWLASEVMFFGGLFAAWFVLKANNEPNWPPTGEELDVARMAVFTAVLVASSFTMHRVVVYAEAGNRSAAIRWLTLTVVMGLAFVINELLEWQSLDFGFSTSAFSTIFYLLTGFHGAHVIAGLVLMTIVAWVVFSSGSRSPQGEGMKVTSYYWHFVDVVWVVLFLVVYVLQ